MIPPYRAVCFDLDGVLIHTMPLHATAWLQTVKQFGHAHTGFSRAANVERQATKERLVAEATGVRENREH